MTGNRSPGSAPDHPHADQPNWRPADTLPDYLAHCREGLEDYTDSRAAEVMGVSRAAVWRMKLMAEIPEDLFERLLFAEGGVPSTKALAAVGRALRDAQERQDVECCPHCGEVLRVRPQVAGPYAEIVKAWAADQGRAGGLLRGGW